MVSPIKHILLQMPSSPNPSPNENPFLKRWPMSSVHVCPLNQKLHLERPVTLVRQAFNYPRVIYRPNIESYFQGQSSVYSSDPLLLT